MWEKLFNLLKLVFTVAEDMQSLKAKVKEHSQQLLELAASQSRLQYELQLQKERAAYERDREAWHRESQHLRERLEQLERLSLPPAPTDKKSDEK